MVIDKWFGKQLKIYLLVEGDTVQATLIAAEEAGILVKFPPPQPGSSGTVVSNKEFFYPWSSIHRIGES